MGIPVCVPECQTNYIAGSFPQLVTLGAQSTPTYGIDAWEWMLTVVPAGSMANVGTNVDFSIGRASVQAARFNADTPGVYSLTVSSHSIDGWSYPVTVEILVEANTATAADLTTLTNRVTVDEGNLTALSGHTIVPSAPLTGGGALSLNPIPMAITQATAGTDGFVTQAKYNAWDAKMSNPMSVLGDMIYGGAGLPSAPTRLAVGAATEVLHGGATPSFGQVVEADLLLADNVTANATAVKHGFAPRLSGAAAEYLNGVGAWATPAGVTSSYTTVATNVGGGGGNVNVIHNFGSYPLVQVLIGGVVTPPGVGSVTSITHNTVNDFTVAYSGAAVGHILASIGSPQAADIVSTGVNYVATNANHIIRATTGGITITLQAVATAGIGREVVVENSSLSNVTVEGDGAELIEGETNQPVPPNSAIRMFSLGAGGSWRIY